MTSAREAIEEQLERDPFLRDAVDRGIINASGLAEWLVEKRDLDHTVDSLAHQLREIQKEASGSRLEGARAALAEADIETLSDRTAFAIPRADHVQQGLSRLIGEMDIGARDDVRLVTGERSVFLVVDEAGAEVARDVLGDLEDPREGLIELRLDPGEDGGDSRLLGLVVEAMTTHGIDVVGAHSGASGSFVLLDETDRAKALTILGQAASD